MKKIGRILSAALACIMALAVLTACGNETAAPYDWQMDKDIHWRVTADGDLADRAAHTIEDGVCTVCGADLTDFGFEFWVQKYNEQGDITLWIIYDENGNITDHTRNEYTYDENGLWTTKKEYEYGVLTSENIFATVSDEEGWYSYQSEIITYNPDGTKLVEKFEPDGSSNTSTLYNADGSVQYDYVKTYTYNEMDLIASIKTCEGDTVVSELTYEYDADGNSVADRTYEYGNLVKEEFYTRIGDEFFSYGYISKIIEYAEDGTQTVTEYDENGEIIG